MGNLYIVATPIGNLEDITLRALRVLKDVDLILCEDTRVTRKLLNYFDIEVDTLSYHQQSSLNKKEEILNLLLGGKNLALVTDAGTPGISDPGNELVDFLLTASADIKIVPIPGASSITAALSVSGFNCNNFLFVGFWPKKKIKKLIEKLKILDCPIVFFESPYRILKTLEVLSQNFPDKRIFIGQELTKVHERSIKGSLANVREQLQKEEKELGRVKGELVCVLE